MIPSRIAALLLGIAILVSAFAGPSIARSGDPPPRLAITMDDLPVHGPLPDGETRRGVAERLAAAFRAAEVPEVYGFVNGAEVVGDPELESVLSTWVAAGFPLGNHTWSHRNLDELTVEEFEGEIVRNEAVLRRFGGAGDWRWFRYPYLVEGSDSAKRAGIRAILARRGYRIAAVTTSFADYEWNDAYLRCRAKQDPEGMETLEEAYLEAVGESIERTRTLSRSIYGRDVPYVLLTHISPFNARMMPRVLEVYRNAGFEFITLAEAERDSIYRADVDPSRPAGPTDLAGRARERGLTAPPRPNRASMLAAACR